MGAAKSKGGSIPHKPPPVKPGKTQTFVVDSITSAGTGYVTGQRIAVAPRGATLAYQGIIAGTGGGGNITGLTTAHPGQSPRVLSLGPHKIISGDIGSGGKVLLVFSPAP
jgi:hypothetical protein